MGYQDGMGLRPGRTRDKLSADRGNSSSTFNAASGYRATGAVSPVREATKSDAMATGSGGALSQFSADVAPKVPKAPGLLQTVGSSVASKVGGKVLENGVDRLGQTTAGRYVNHAMSGSDIPFDAIERANASADPIADLAGSQGWYQGVSGDVPGSGGDLFFDDWGAGSDLSAGAEFADGASAIDAASATGSSMPGFGTVMAGFDIVGDIARGDTTQIVGDALGGSFVGNIMGAMGCFITEATMAGLGVQDDEAEPLQVLRFFRDKVLAGTPQGQAMIQEYEDIAPLVVEAIQSRPDAMEIFKKLYTDFIAPAVEAIKAQNFPQALQIYAAMIAAVTPLAQEAMDAEDAMEGEMQQAGEPQEGPQEAMQQMGQHAGMVAQNPQVAQQAAPQGALQQFNADEEYPSSVRFGRQ